MDKLNSALSYYNGVKAYSFFLLNQFGDTSFDGSLILEKNNYNAAKVAFISSILLGAKEDIVEKLPNLEFGSLIYEDDLIKNVKLIATKDKDDYVIDNYKFSSAAEVVAMIRNKFAHGNFELDLEHSRIIFDFAGTKVKLNIDKLTNFVVIALNNYYEKSQNKKYYKVILESDKVLADRKKTFSSPTDVKNFILNLNKFSVSLKRKDGEIIPHDLKSILDGVVNGYKKDMNLKVFLTFKHFINDEYDFDWGKSKAVIDDIDDFSTGMYNQVKDLDYDSAVNFVMNSVADVILKNNKTSHMTSSLRNLLLLDATYHTNSISKDKLFNYLSDKFGNYFFIGNRELASSSICLFQTLFAYLHDDYFDNDNKYTSLPNNGLKYAALDVSCFNIDYLKADRKVIDQYLEVYNGASKRLLEIRNKINQNTLSLNAVKQKGNLKAASVLSQNIANEKLLEAQYAQDEINAKASYDEAILYEANNLDLIKNRAIINGIRNSIAHGNYTFYVEDGVSKILFEDLYEGECTFRASVSVVDFLNFIYASEAIVTSFINSKIKVNEASL